MHRLLFTTFAICMAVAGGVRAEGSAAYDPRAAFAETDTNKDGHVDIGEFHARITEVFYNADANKDGYLEVDELETLPLNEPMEQADRNGDGKVVLEEFVRVRVHQFMDADGDDDVELSVDEVVEAYEVEQ